jgi:hypothetical protein
MNTRRAVEERVVEDYEFDDAPEEPHEFVTDVRNVVLTNLELVLASIAKAHKAEVEEFEPPDNGIDQQPYIDWLGSKYDGLRRAAINLALVGVVTRFHHWLIYLANRRRNNQTFDRNVEAELTFLNSQFKNSPHKPLDFKKWIDVRDSIIHADSKAKWTFRGDPRDLEPRFVQTGELSFTEADLNEAFQHMLSAVWWYENQVELRERAKDGPPIIFKSPQA